jgi:hypothetical protein
MPCDGQELLSVDHEFLYMIFGSSSSFFVISTIDNATIIERSFLTSATNTALPLKSFATNFVVNLSSSHVMDAHRTSLVICHKKDETGTCFVSQKRLAKSMPHSRNPQAISPKRGHLCRYRPKEHGVIQRSLSQIVSSKPCICLL